jgi:hypothetical protein
MEDFFANLDDDLASASKPAPTNLDKLQVANGGTKEGVTCMACKGRGNFYSYTGRLVGPCFKCKGSGKMTTGSAAAFKGRETKKANDAAWHHAHHAEIAYMGHRAERSSFFASLQQKFRDSGRLSDNQLAAIRKDMAEEPARKAAFQAKRDAERAANATDVDISRIEQLFDAARSNGLKKLKFRTEECDISPAPEHGRNAGALYVTKNGEYFGKIASGKFYATKEAPASIGATLVELAKDPLSVGIAYGKQTGKCCCCGRELTDPVSVERGIGPICETKWEM